MSTLLVIAAHPDDEVLGCGGTLARAVAEGHEVRVLILATGVASRHGDAPAADVQRAIQGLQAEATRAHAALGIPAEHVVFGAFPDQGLDTCPRRELVGYLREHVARHAPERVLTHHPQDYNLDHRIVFDAVLSATRPYLGEAHPTELCAFETVSSTEWGWQPRDAFRPTVYTDISAYLEQKQAALEAYASEMRPFPHPRSVEAVTHLARRRGSEVSRPAAEAFELVRWIR